MSTRLPSASRSCAGSRPPRSRPGLSCMTPGSRRRSRSGTEYYGNGPIPGWNMKLSNSITFTTRRKWPDYESPLVITAALISRPEITPPDPDRHGVGEETTFITSRLECLVTRSRLQHSRSLTLAENQIIGSSPNYSSRRRGATSLFARNRGGVTIIRVKHTPIKYNVKNILIMSIKTASW